MQRATFCADRDFFETSWDFKCHPLVRLARGYVAPYSFKRYSPKANRYLTQSLKSRGEIGNTYTVTHHYYGLNGVVLTSNRHFTLRNVEIWATWGLGVETRGRRALEVVNNRGVAYTLFKEGTLIKLKQQDFSSVKGWTGRITKIDGNMVHVDKYLPKQSGICFVLVAAEFATENFIFKNCRFHGSDWSRGLILGNNITFDGCTFGPMNGPALRFQSCYTYNVWCEGIGCRNIIVAESPMLIYDGEPIPSFGDEPIAASNFRDAQF